MMLRRGEARVEGSARDLFVSVEVHEVNGRRWCEAVLLQQVVGPQGISLDPELEMVITDGTFETTTVGHTDLSPEDLMLGTSLAIGLGRRELSA